MSMVETRPLLVIVSGAPNSGKTTLNRRLTASLHLPLLSKDRFKEVLGDTIGADDRDASTRLGAAAHELLYATAGWLLDAGSGAIVESNFWRGTSEPALGQLCARARPVMIHCDVSLPLLLDRHAERIARAERHAVHFDLGRLDALRAAIEEGRYEPLGLDVPTICVDTSDGYSPSFNDILAFIWGPMR
jgi:predicted kinase